MIKLINYVKNLFKTENKELKIFKLKLKESLEHFPIDYNIKFTKKSIVNSVSVSTPKEYRNDLLTKHDIDIKVMLFNVIVNEFTQCLYKHATKYLTNNSDLIEVWGLKDVDFSKYKYAIVNCKLATFIQDLHNYEYKKLSTELKPANGGIYEIGKIDGCNLYVDPYMKFNENIILMFNEPFINFDVIINKNKISEDIYSPYCLLLETKPIDSVIFKINDTLC